jgi:hypothetical protein
MSDKRTAEEWGRVAVSLPGWRWMPGTVTIGDIRLLDVYPESGDWTGVFASKGGTVLVAGFEDHDLPDPDDPATAGCLLALVQGAIDVSFQCSAWWTTYNVRCSRLTVGMTGDGDKWEVRAHGHDPHHNAGWSKPVATGSSLGRACIAAAEALGRWPGGAS